MTTDERRTCILSPPEGWHEGGAQALAAPRQPAQRRWCAHLEYTLEVGARVIERAVQQRVEHVQDLLVSEVVWQRRETVRNGQ